MCETLARKKKSINIIKYLSRVQREYFKPRPIVVFTLYSVQKTILGIILFTKRFTNKPREMCTRTR